MRAVKISAEHGGYPKSERLVVEGEVGVVDRPYAGETDEEVEEGIAKLEAQLQVLEGGLSDEQ